MTPQEKIIDVERQVRAMVEGDQEPTFYCPFCGTASNEFHNLLCCNEAAEVVSAVLDHMEHLERVEIVDRAMDRLEAMQAKALVN